MNSLSRRPLISPEIAKQVWFWRVRRKRRWRQKMKILRELRANGCSSTRWSDTWRKVKVSKWKSPSWSITCLDQKMRTSASSRSLKVPKMNVVVKISYCSTVKKEVEALRWLMQYVKPNGADHLWIARERAELRQQEKTDSKYTELIPECDARTSRDRVIMARMTAHIWPESGRTSSSR